MCFAVASLLFSLSQCLCWCDAPRKHTCWSRARVFFIAAAAVAARKSIQKCKADGDYDSKRVNETPKPILHLTNSIFVDGTEAWRCFVRKPVYENVLKTSERKLAKYSNNMINVIQLAAAAVVVIVDVVVAEHKYACTKKKARSEVIRCENVYCFSFRKANMWPNSANAFCTMAQSAQAGRRTQRSADHTFFFLFLFSTRITCDEIFNADFCVRTNTRAFTHSCVRPKITAGDEIVWNAKCEMRLNERNAYKIWKWKWQFVCFSENVSKFREWFQDPSMKLPHRIFWGLINRKYQ